MSVIGFDIGNANCIVAAARAGGIETLANDYSDRCTPAVVGFNNANRVTGISARNQLITNLKSTVSQFKRLIGRNFDEPEVQNELKHQNCNVVRLENGGIGLEVNYRGEPVVYTPEQLMGMLLNELKKTAELNIQTKVTDCVISVPSFYTDFQRRALLQCAEIAGLNCLRLMNETSAVALNYGLFKQDLPTPEEKSRHVVFVDLGHSAYQVSVVAFNKGKIRMLATVSDPCLGGRDFDERLRHYFADEIKKKYKLDVRSNKRAWTRLGTDVEKIKKQMSSNTSDLPLNIECLMEDTDVSLICNREKFEELSQDLIARLPGPLEQALQESGLTAADINFVELVGGSTRIPALKAAIGSVFNVEPTTTLNLDEAVARGCAIQCAMLSHTVRVRDIEVLDATAYPISITWDAIKPEEGQGEMEVFKKFHTFPFTKMLTFPHRTEPFCFKAFYHEKTQIPHYKREIGKFVVNAAAPTQSDTAKVKVKVKVRLDIHGCFTVSSASMVESLPPEEQKDEPMDTATNEVKEDATKTESQPESQEKTDTTPAKEGEDRKKADKPEDKKSEKKAKKLTKSTDLQVITEKDQVSSRDITTLINIENELLAHIRFESEKAAAKNAVEEYVYEMRSKIYDVYEKNMTDSDREAFADILSKTEDWLYDEGENESKQVYVDKLAELKKIGNPVVDRYNTYKDLPSAFEQLGSSLTHFRKILDLYSKKDEKYEHIEEAEMKKVHDKVQEKLKWLNEKMQVSAKTLPTANPSVYPGQVLSEKKVLVDFCNPIVNKPKPKVEPPPQKKEEKTDDNAKQNGETQEKMDTDNNKGDFTTEKKPNIDMEVD